MQYIDANGGITNIPNKYIYLPIICLVAFIFLFASINVVSAGERAIKATLGEVSPEVLTEGIHFKIPLIQKIYIFDIKTQKIETSEAAASNDLQTVTINIALNYNLEPNSINRLYTEIGRDYEARIIIPALQEAIKASTAKFTAEQLITQREQVKDTAFKILAERLSKYYVIVSNVSIINLEFSASFNQAIEAKVTAEQDALAAKNKLAQIEFEAQQKIATAKADAESIKLQSEALQQSKDLVQLKAVEKWNGVLPIYMMPDSSVPFININK